MAFARNRYQIESSLGKGGMGEVYLARDTLLERTVALKVLTYANEPDPKAAAKQLLREARLGAALKHPNVVTTHDLGEENGTAFIVMELIEGQNLRSLIALPTPGDASQRRRRLKWLAEIASALDAAHKQGVVHRDIKPENVMIGNDGTAKVLDFGIAKHHGLRDIPVGAASSTGGAANSTTGTMSGVMGTPRYMAPEQWLGVADARSDQYSWGLMAYEVLSGDHPKLANDGRPRTDRRSLGDHGVDAAVGDAIERAMHQDPAGRHASLADLVRVLQRSIGDSGVTAAASSALGTHDERAIAETKSRPAVAPAHAASQTPDAIAMSATEYSPEASRMASTPPPPPASASASASSPQQTMASAGLAAGTVRMDDVTTGGGAAITRGGALSYQDNTGAHGAAKSGKTTWLLAAAAIALAIVGGVVVQAKLGGSAASSNAAAPTATTATTAVEAPPAPIPSLDPPPTATDESMPTASSPSSPSSSSSTPPRKRIVPRTAPRNCKPPYTINSEGVHIPKPECL